MKKITLILSLLIGNLLMAQDTFEGTIIRKMTYENVSPEMKAYLSMMPTSTTTTVKENISKTVTPSGMGETVVLIDNESGEMITLIDQMGNKIAVKSNVNETKEEDIPEIEYMEEEKEILGYKCKKAVIETDNGEMIFYYTKELPDMATSQQDKRIDGFVMEMKMVQDQFTLTSTVSEINEGKVKKIKMEVPSDYDLKTIEELQKMGQGSM